MFFSYRLDESSTFTKIKMQKANEIENYIRYSCKASFSDCGLYFYRFELSSENGTYIFGKDNLCSEWQLTVYDKDFKTPEWAYGGIMYQIFPDRFCHSDNYMQGNAKNERKIHKCWYDVPDFIYDNPDYKGNDFFCGNLDGIIEKIGYLKTLGVSVIYLNPIFESAQNHRYSTGDYTKVDPYLGTNEDFKRLCEACKKENIKVILDGVFSHTGADSVYFNKFGHYDSVGAYQGKASPYYDWYSFNDSKTGYECWWGFENLPNVNEENPSYLEFITGKDGILSLWQRYGASGFRLDVADELPDAFLDALYKRVKEENPKALILGEVWEDATNKFSYGKRRRYLLGKQLDSVMNYPWRNAIIDYIKEANADVFKERVLDILENYPEPSLNCLMNILSTHDTERIINTFGVIKEVSHRDAASYKLTDEEYKRGKEKLKMAVFLQFSLPGIPSIYYGDEVGLCGFRDPYSRMCYPFGREDIELFDYYKSIGKLRTEHKADFSAPLTCLCTKNSTVMFERGKLLFVINAGDFDENIKKDAKFVTIYGDKNVIFENGNIKVPKKSYAIMLKI